MESFEQNLNPIENELKKEEVEVPQSGFSRKLRRFVQGAALGAGLLGGEAMTHPLEAQSVKVEYAGSLIDHAAKKLDSLTSPAEASNWGVNLVTSFSKELFDHASSTRSSEEVKAIEQSSDHILSLLRVAEHKFSTMDLHNAIEEMENIKSNIEHATESKETLPNNMLEQAVLSVEGIHIDSRIAAMIKGKKITVISSEHGIEKAAKIVKGLREAGMVVSSEVKELHKDRSTINYGYEDFRTARVLQAITTDLLDRVNLDSHLGTPLELIIE